LPRKSKNHQKKPTIPEFLTYKPLRAEYEWFIDEEGLVHIKVPKFQSKWGKRLCRLLHRKEMFTADMDKIGSVVWIHADGSNTVSDILEIIRKKYGEQENLDQRLFLFLQQMKNLNYLSY
jgi:hypothetical protein